MSAFAYTFSPLARRALMVGSFLAASIGGAALASTITQNTTWTINRSGTDVKYRVTAYGDSIFAGYNGSLFSVARRAAPMVAGEYASAAWGTDVEVVRRTKSGAVASDIYNNKIVGERSYMQSTSTRVVMFEMCGNDFLQARSSFKGQTGTCNYSVATNALNNCTTYTQAAINYINGNAYAGTKVKIVSNIYYPGYAADNVLSSCTDATTGQRVNFRDKFIPYLAQSNWRTCNYARSHGFQCADAFADWMGADYDSNGDGQVDSVALRYLDGETEADYVNRITVTLKATLRDANSHLLSASSSADYLQSDDTHPTYYTSNTIGLNIFTGNGSGSGAPEFSVAPPAGNAVWNRYGHERMGFGEALFLPAAP